MDTSLLLRGVKIIFELGKVRAKPYEKNGRYLLDVGIYLPNIKPDKGYELLIKIIHQNDQFTPGIGHEEFKLEYKGGEYDLWQNTIDMSSTDSKDGHFGSPGKYLYHYQLMKDKNIAVNWFFDPFARHTESGAFSTFEMGEVTTFNWEDTNFQVPDVDDMVVYRLVVGEFNRDFEGVNTRLNHLFGIGINVIELMSITDTNEAFGGGYLPLSYFASEDRYGGKWGLKRLVNECHKREIAVILNSVYAHAHTDFAFNKVYNTTGEPNPMMGHFAEDSLGERTDYSKPFARDFFHNVNRYFLDEYHVDGFRYDNISGFYSSPVGEGYSALVYDTYQYSKNIKRFQCDEGYSRIIQCAEHLPEPSAKIINTCANGFLKNHSADKEKDVSLKNLFDENFENLLKNKSQNYPYEYCNPSIEERFPVNVFRYVETHEPNYFINNFGLTDEKDALGLKLEDRSKWYKLQPYIIALYTCQGIPMLWQGQEFGENNSVPYLGPGGVFLRRPLNWRYFYDDAGQNLVGLYRKMGSLRKKYIALRSRKSQYYEQSIPDKGVIVYDRVAEFEDSQKTHKVMVFLNFSDSDFGIWIPFSNSGCWDELLHHQDHINVENDGDWHYVLVPSNYGRLFSLG